MGITATALSAFTVRRLCRRSNRPSGTPPTHGPINPTAPDAPDSVLPDVNISMHSVVDIGPQASGVTTQPEQQGGVIADLNNGIKAAFDRNLERIREMAAKMRYKRPGRVPIVHNDSNLSGNVTEQINIDDIPETGPACNMNNSNMDNNEQKNVARIVPNVSIGTRPKTFDSENSKKETKSETRQKPPKDARSKKHMETIFPNNSFLHGVTLDTDDEDTVPMTIACSSVINQHHDLQAFGPPPLVKRVTADIANMLELNSLKPHCEPSVEKGKAEIETLPHSSENQHASTNNKPSKLWSDSTQDRAVGSIEQQQIAHDCDVNNRTRGNDVCGVSSTVTRGPDVNNDNNTADPKGQLTSVSRGADVNNGARGNSPRLVLSGEQVEHDITADISTCECTDPNVTVDIMAVSSTTSHNESTTALIPINQSTPAPVQQESNKPSAEAKHAPPTGRRAAITRKVKKALKYPK